MEFPVSHRNTFIKWGVTLVVPLIFLCFPITAEYTVQLRIFFMITAFVLLLTAMDLVPILIPSVLLPTMYYLSGIVPINQAFGAFTTPTVWMIFGALIFANTLDECGLLRRIALGCICRCGGTFTGTLYGLFFAGVIVMFIAFSQAFILLVTLTYGICKAMNLEKSNESALVCIAGMLGGVTTLSWMYNPGYLALGEAGIRSFEPGFTILWYESLLYNGPIFFLSLGLIWLLTKIYRTKDIQFEGGREYFRKAYEKLGPVSLQEKKALFIVFLLMVYLFSTPVHKLPAAWGFMTLPYVLFFPGFRVGSIETVKKTNFSIMFFIAGCLCIGVVASALGAEKLISTLVSPLIAGQSSLAVLLLLLLMGTVCNLFMTPYAMMAALSLPFGSLGVEAGITPLSSIMALMMSTDLIFMPYEIAPCLLMYSFGMISMGNFVKFYSFKTVATFIFFICLIWPYWKLCGWIQ